MDRLKHKLPALAAAVFIGALLPGVLANPAYADDSASVQAEPGAMVRQFSLGVGKALIVELPREASEIFVADPKVANAVVRSQRKIYLMAIGPGQTSIFAMDAAGKQIAVLNVTTGRDINALGHIFKTAMPKADINPRTVNDTIILTGSVDSAGEAQMAVDIAKGFVGQIAGGVPKDGSVINSLVIRGRDQVMLKVTIAEVQRKVLKQVGVSQGIGNAGSSGSFSMQNPFVQSLSASNLIAGNAAAIAAGTAKGIAAEIKAYERNGVARILAEPTVTAVSGESAKFTAGGEIPVSSSESCTPTGGCLYGVTFKPYGVTLNFTPVVLAEGRILLRVATEVTELDPTTTVAFTNSSVAGFRTRKNETTVELPSGGSIVSAGLIQSITNQTVNGIPGLMNLPVLGSLFRSRDYQRQETELMIIVTPYIAKSIKANEISRPTDGFVDASDPQALLLGRVNKIYSTADNPALLQNYHGRVGFIAD